MQILLEEGMAKYGNGDTPRNAMEEGNRLVVWMMMVLRDGRFFPGGTFFCWKQCTLLHVIPIPNR